MPSCVWVRVPSLARSQNGRKLPRPLLSVRASGLPASLPSVTDMTSPQGEYTSPTIGRSHSHRTAEDSLDHLFCASFGRTHNEGGGLLPPGHATRITLIISTLGIFRVVKTTTLISVKQMINSNLQVALQNAETLTFCFHVNLFLRFSWAKVRNHKKRVNMQPRRRLPYCRRYRKSETEINRPTIYGSCHGGYIHPDFYEPFSVLEAIRYHITFVVNLFQGCFRSAIDLEFKHID